MGIADKVGSLKAGKRADLIMVSTRAINMGVFGDPAHMLPNNLYGPACSPKGFNGGCYQSAQVDGLLDSALKVYDRDQRGAIYKQIQTIVADDAPWIFVDNQIQNAAISTRVSGLDLHPSFYMTFLNRISAA